MRARKARRQVAAAVLGLGIGIVAAGSPALAADRAYELVTPAGSDPEVKQGGGVAVPNGNVVCFNTEEAIAGSTSNGIVTADDGFCSYRTATGWETRWVTGPAPRENFGSRGSQVYFISPDGARVVFASDAGIFPDFPGYPPGVGSVFGTLSAFMYEGGQTRWLAPSPVPLREEKPAETPAIFNEREAVGASEDLTHGIFVSILRLVPEDGNSESDMYEWTPDGVRLVSRDASGAAIGGFPAIGADWEQVMAEPGSITSDGSRIFFERRGTPLEGSPADVRSVFMREGETLRLVSPRRGPGPDADVSFAGSYDDGRIVFLRTAEQLTNDPKQAGEALYRYDVDSDELELFATDPNGVYFLGASADGSTVAYRTGALEMHVNRNGVDRVLGTFGFTDTIPLFDGGATERSDKRALRISPDGGAIVFASAGDFDGPSNGMMQVYRWTPADGVRRISNDATGAPAASESWIGNFSSGFPDRPRQALLNTMRSKPNLGRVMSDDGSRVFFETAEPLVAADINRFVDVYEWRDGVIRLISPGSQRNNALYHDSSADGSTVFFTTRSALIPELDRNTSYDLYAAREGGGFPLPERPRRCEGEACQGLPETPPALPRTGSTTFDGPGDVDEPTPADPRHSLRKLSRSQLKAFARSGQTVLRVQATDKGVLTATASARFGRRTLQVASATRAARAGATVRVPLKLSARARGALRRGRRLRLVIKVAYSESDTTVRRVVVLRG